MMIRSSILAALGTKAAIGGIAMAVATGTVAAAAASTGSPNPVNWGQHVVQVVQAAGGRPKDVLSLRIYVTDKRQYLAQLREVGQAYWVVFGRWFPAMALVQVADLLEEGALVEIEALAAIPPPEEASR